MYIDLIGKYITKNIENILSRIGYSDGLLVESILTTFKSDGFHSAPIGIKRLSNTLFSKIFKDTDTYVNLMKKPYAVANLLDDIELFYITTFDELPMDEYDEVIYKTGIKPLRNADLIIELYLEEYSDFQEYIEARFKIIGLIIRRLRPCYYTRCKHAVLESLIHSTRIPIFKEVNRIEFEKLMMLINHYSQLVNRICPEDPYKRIMRAIIEKLNSNY